MTPLVFDRRASPAAGGDGGSSFVPQARKVLALLRGAAIPAWVAATYAARKRPPGALSKPGEL
ncbi:hypothetical protein [Rhodocyclus tenuis]|uniref:hypothetical protein n=1 Tax=Rhodocyclus tenuis TaxID=1066 RepID=UPI0019087E1B|nr:hypothetical protein [Rhodocyclus tenuis]MBK1680825.1 hypothetical protein [Rhodocyclus tenuis]